MRIQCGSGCSSRLIKYYTTLSFCYLEIKYFLNARAQGEATGLYISWEKRRGEAFPMFCKNFPGMDPGGKSNAAPCGSGSETLHVFATLTAGAGPGI